MPIVNGIYSAQMSAVAGEGLVILVLRDGVLTGVDTGQVLFDGTFETACDGAIFGNVTIKAPPDGVLIQGIPTGPHGLTYSTAFAVPADFDDKPFLRFETPFGPVNAKLQLLRPL